MIGRLSGRLDYRAQDHVLIDVREPFEFEICAIPGAEPSP